MKRIAEIIVDRRNLLFLLYIIAIVFSMFSVRWVQVENDIVYYLPEDSKTRQGIIVMEEEFTTPGMADIMISNISYEHAKEISEEIAGVHGVSSVMFENTQEYYKDSSALFVVLFNGEDTDDISLRAMDEILDIVGPYDVSISTTVGVDPAAQLAKDMILIGVLAAIIIVFVLILTSQSYVEVPLLLVTFGVAALLNMGTNFMLGKISFISHSVGAILQLALAIDYAIILCHRFNEECEEFPAREAAVHALTKAIPEISSSSLTTIAGLGALAFMQFGIGKDLAAVLIKAIFLSMFTVFTLLPGLLVACSDLIQKAKHRRFIPSVSAIGRFSIKTRYIVPPIFALILIVSFVFSSKCPFVFSLEDIRAYRVSETQMAKDRIAEVFGTKNMLALIVPSGDYGAEKNLLTALGRFEEIESAVGLSNTEAIGGYMLTDSLTPREFAELVDLDFDLAQVLYSAYALNNEDFGKIISGIGYYSVPLIDMYQFLYEQVSQGYIPIEHELMEELENYNQLISIARAQLEGENFARMMLCLNLPVESEETYDFLSVIYKEAGRYYDDSQVYLVGESGNALDLSLTFDKDNLVISILSVLFVIIILTFTFQSAGLPILLISVIQASIWINFSLPYIKGEGIYFLGFLLVSSIQMGANIDYAIVITSRYQALKEELPVHEAVVQALNQGFPTVITSGSILAVAGILIGRISTDGATSVLGTCLGRGTIISIVLVIFVLPQLLYLGDAVIERTSFKLNPPTLPRPAKEKVRFSGSLDGYVKGEVHGYVDGTITGEIRPAKAIRSENKDENSDEEV